jgi:hypothetical protein
MENSLLAEKGIGIFLQSSVSDNDKLLQKHDNFEHQRAVIKGSIYNYARKRKDENIEART